jgi:hypothetical protein
MPNLDAMYYYSYRRDAVEDASKTGGRLGMQMLLLAWNRRVHIHNHECYNGAIDLDSAGN